MVSVNAIQKATSGGIFNFNGGINTFPQTGPYPGLGYATSKEIIAGMEDNLCRCGSYNRIVEAIQTAASKMKE